MKTKIIFFYLTAFFVLTSCSTTMKYNNSMFNQTYYENKTICFSLSEESDEKGIAKVGSFMSRSKPPINRVIFKKSIEKLALETKLNLKYLDNVDDIAKDEILINVNIKNLSYISTLSSVTMTCFLEYELINDNDSFEIIGIHKSVFEGSIDKNLYYSLKNANYLFLKKLENK